MTLLSVRCRHAHGTAFDEITGAEVMHAGRIQQRQGQCIMPAMILTAFGDETGTHNDSPVIMLGGYVARLGQVNSFNPLWRRGLSRTGLPYWHGTEHWDTEAGAKLAMVAHKLVRRDVLFGYVIELDNGASKAGTLAGGRPDKPQLDTRYGVCFRFLAALSLQGCHDRSVAAILWSTFCWRTAMSARPTASDSSGI